MVSIKRETLPSAETLNKSGAGAKDQLGALGVLVEPGNQQGLLLILGGERVQTQLVRHPVAPEGKTELAKIMAGGAGDSGRGRRLPLCAPLTPDFSGESPCPECPKGVLACAQPGQSFPPGQGCCGKNGRGIVHPPAFSGKAIWNTVQSNQVLQARSERTAAGQARRCAFQNLALSRQLRVPGMGMGCVMPANTSRGLLRQAPVSSRQGWDHLAGH